MNRYIFITNLLVKRNFSKYLKKDSLQEIKRCKVQDTTILELLYNGKLVHVERSSV